MPESTCCVRHGDARTRDDETTCVFLADGGQMQAPDPQALADLLGAHSKGRGGSLELVFLNGCCTSKLGEAVHKAGVPCVVCWRTVVNDEAASKFSEAFFDELDRVGDYRKAFASAKNHLELHCGASGNLGRRAYAFKNPRHPGDKAFCDAMGQVAVGVPELICAEPSEDTQWAPQTSAGGAGSTCLVPSAPPAQCSTRTPREVITLCIEGDLSAFNEARELKLRRALAGLLANEMSHENIKVVKHAVSAKVAAKIGTARCRLRVEVDREGFAQYSTDDGTESEETCSEMSTEDVIEAHVSHLTSSLHWPKVEAQDIEVIWKGAGSVIVVLLLPAAAAHVLYQLVEQSVSETPKQCVVEIENEGICGCKLADCVAFSKRVTDWQAHAKAMRAAEEPARRMVEEQWEALQGEAVAADDGFDPEVRRVLFAADHYS
eukprot:2968669-Prymnesium_polylepis.1